MFQAINRQVTTLASKATKSRTVGLDQKLLHDLLQAGYRCPGFNDRQKFTLAANSMNPQEIANFPDIAKFWPFDTLSTKPTASQEDIFVRFPPCFFLDDCFPFSTMTTAR
jgi:hypothetical protein